MYCVRTPTGVDCVDNISQCNAVILLHIDMRSKLGHCFCQMLNVAGVMSTTTTPENISDPGSPQRDQKKARFDSFYFSRFKHLSDE